MMKQENQSINTRPPKKRGGCLGAFLKFFLVLALIVLVVVGIIAVIFHVREKAAKEARIADMEAGIHLTQTDFSAFLAQESDIAGLTRGEKAEMGLLPDDGADTDGDGLTDKEEIEQYDSDPTQFSTAGDMFGDGYKVANALDVSTKLSEDATHSPMYCNEFENITPKGDTAADTLGVFEEVTWNLGDLEVYKAYRVYDFNGSVTIDFSDDVPEGEFSFFVMTDGVYRVIKKGIENNTVTVDVDSVKNETTIIGISAVYKSANGALAMLGYGGVTLLNEDALSTGDIIVMTSLAYVDQTGEGIYVFEQREFLKPRNVSNESFFSKELSKQWSDQLGKEVKVTFKYLPPANMAALKPMLAGIQSARGKAIEMAGLEEVGAYFDYIYTYDFYPAGTFDGFEGLMPEPPETPKETAIVTDTEVITSFDISYDALPFPNISTYLGFAGNCGGYAEVTARLFNENMYLEADELQIGEGVMSYDISDPAFATFFDRGLSDYQSALYYREKYPGDELMHPEAITDPEDKAFVEFIGAFLAHQNAATDPQLYFFGSAPSYDIIEAAAEHLKQNKILTLSINAGSGGHAVNVYGIEYDEKDPNKAYLLVYDCNLPNDILYCESGGMKQGNCRIEITKRAKNFFSEENNPETEYVFDFVYQPVAELSSYRFANKDFVVADSASGVENVISAATQPCEFRLTTEDGTNICPPKG